MPNPHPIPLPNPLPARAVVGMVHVGPLPGAPFESRSLDEQVEHASREAKLLADAGFEGLIVENMHDRPYVHGRQGPEVVASMTRLVLACRQAAPNAVLGVQILSGGAQEAMAVALAAGASFIRCENFVFSHIADEGFLPTAEAGALLRFRRSIGASSIRVFADIKKKHASHAITADVAIAETAEAAAFFAADGVIVSGAATGKPAAPDDVRSVRAATKLPLLIGSGVTPEQLGTLFEFADAVIVGTAIKADGVWSNPLDKDRCERLMDAARKARRAFAR